MRTTAFPAVWFDSATPLEEVARPAGRIEAGELCTRREVVQRELVTPGNGDDLRGLCERVET
jgi:hypothetical protein